MDRGSVELCLGLVRLSIVDSLDYISVSLKTVIDPSLLIISYKDLIREERPPFALKSICRVQVAYHSLGEVAHILQTVLAGVLVEVGPFDVAEDPVVAVAVAAVVGPETEVPDLVHLVLEGSP